MGKNDTLLIIGAAAVALYMFKDVIAKPFKDVGNVTGGIASPFSYLQTVGNQQEKNIITRETIYRESLEKPTITEIIYRDAKATEETKTTKSEREASNQIMATTATTEANKANLPEAITRKTEYGSTPTQYLQKIFMPTKEAATQRRQSVVNLYTSLDKKVGGFLPGGSKNIISKTITSIFKKKK